MVVIGRCILDSVNSHLCKADFGLKFVFGILQVAKIGIGRLKTVSTTIGVNTIEIVSYT